MEALPLRRQQPGEFQIGSFRFRVAPVGERLVVHCDLFPTVVFGRPRSAVEDEADLVEAAARRMAGGSYGPLDVPRGFTWEGWQERIAELAAELDAGAQPPADGGTTGTGGATGG